MQVANPARSKPPASPRSNRPPPSLLIPTAKDGIRIARVATFVALEPDAGEVPNEIPAAAATTLAIALPVVVVRMPCVRDEFSGL